MTKRTRTPAEKVGGIIEACMSCRHVSAADLGKAVGVCANTVYRDLREPEGITIDRMFRYFLALEVPIDEAMTEYAEAVCRMMVEG